MKCTRLLKKCAVVLLFLFVIGTPFCHIETSTTVQASEVQPLSDDIRWVYVRRVNGILYRRLYNFTTQTWVGSWQIVG